MKFGLSVLLAAIMLAQAADWPQWLGPTRDGHVTDLSLEQLPADLKPVWRISIGGGFSSPIIAGTELLYFDEDGTDEVAHLVNATTGKEIWKTTIASRFTDEWGAGPRSTPTIAKGRVFVQSCNGEFQCLELLTGKILWQTSFEKDFGVKFLGSKAQEGTAARRGNNGSPLMDGEDVIVPVGSTNNGTLVCFEAKSGKVVWQSGTDEAAYSSPQIAVIDGVRQVVYLSADALMGFQRKNGKVLWRVPLKTAAKRHAATPVVLGSRVIVNSHTFGLICFSISQTNGTWTADQHWINPEMKINLSTPVHADGFLYSQGPKRTFVCVDTDTGKLKWQQPGFGKEYSSTVVAGKNLLILTDEGQLVMAACNPERYTELRRIQACGKNWNFPAVADGRLYVRDGRELLCYELLSKAAPIP